MENLGLLAEIDEDLRQERLQKFFAKYGLWLAVAAAAVVVFAAGSVFWQQHQAQKSMAATDQLLAQFKVPPIQRGSDKMMAALADIAQNSPAGMAALAQLQTAQLHEHKGQLPEAEKALQAVAQSRAPQPLKDMAALQLARLQLSANKPDFDAIEKTLKPLLADNNAYQPMAQELQSLSLFAQGKKADATKIWADLAVALKAPAGVRQRASAYQALVAQGN